MKRVRYQRELVRVQQARFFILATAPAAGKIHLRVEELRYFGGILFDPPATNPSFVCFYFFFFFFLFSNRRPPLFGRPPATILGVSLQEEEERPRQRNRSSFASRFSLDARLVIITCICIFVASLQLQMRRFQAK